MVDMEEGLTIKDVVALLDEQVRLCGYSQKTVAFNLGISPQYLNDILRNRGEPGPKVLKALGLEKASVYKHKKIVYKRSGI